jgi:hypothetical protein
MPRFLVSCCNVGGKLFVLEQHGASTTVDVVLDAPSTGLVVSAARQRVYAAYPNGVRALNYCLEPLTDEHYDTSGADVHDVKCVGDSLLVVETSFNRVTSYAAPNNAEWSWHPSKGDRDRSHVNSVTVRGSTVIASMFSPEGDGPPWSDRLDGALVRIPLDRSVGGRILARGVSQPHSLIERAGTLWLCESYRNRVLSLNASGDFTVEAEFPSYTRGLAVSDGWMVVGQSRSDAHFVRPLIGDRAPSAEPGECGVWFVSLSSDTRFFVELPALELYDIVELPV